LKGQNSKKDFLKTVRLSGSGTSLTEDLEKQRLPIVLIFEIFSKGTVLIDDDAKQDELIDFTFRGTCKLSCEQSSKHQEPISANSEALSNSSNSSERDLANAELPSRRIGCGTTIRPSEVLKNTKLLK
jgi:hypothetical protein